MILLKYYYSYFIKNHLFTITKPFSFLITPELNLIYII